VLALLRTLVSTCCLQTFPRFDPPLAADAVAHDNQPQCSAGVHQLAETDEWTSVRPWGIGAWPVRNQLGDQRDWPNCQARCRVIIVAFLKTAVLGHKPANNPTAPLKIWDALPACPAILFKIHCPAWETQACFEDAWPVSLPPAVAVG